MAFILLESTSVNDGSEDKFKQLKGQEFQTLYRITTNDYRYRSVKVHSY